MVFVFCFELIPEFRLDSAMTKTGAVIKMVQHLFARTTKCYSFQFDDDKTSSF